MLERSVTTKKRLEIVVTAAEGLAASLAPLARGSAAVWNASGMPVSCMDKMKEMLL